MVMVYQRFVLAKETIDLLKQLPNPFQDNAFGEIVFYRTYSRIKLDSKYNNVGQETWLDIVIRVIQGTFSIRKDWYIKNNIHWDERLWQNYARLMAISMYKMEWLPPGRGLWAMGTDFIYEEGSMALQNCAFIKITDNIADGVGWLMDALMLGVGVGFEPIRNNDFKTYNPKGYFDYTIPDSREGWVESVKLLINTYCKSNQKEPRFNYEEIRPAGSLIKRFGGISSGPDPLKLFHDQIRYFFKKYYDYNNGNNNEYYDIIMLKTDIVNCVGCCVIAANVRRSAELCKGKITDKTFLELKQYENPIFAYRVNYAWMSNNSAALYEDEDFNYLGEVAERIKVRAEPGILNLRNFNQGRVGKKGIGREKEKDQGDGCNPCHKFSSPVLTPRGIVKFGTLKEGDIIWSQLGWTKVTKIWSTGINKVYKYTTTAGIFEGTENHKIISNGIKIPIKDATNVDVIKGPYNKINEFDPQAIMDGLLIGDGTNFGGRVCLCIGQDDSDYFKSEITNLINTKLGTVEYSVISNISIYQLNKLPYRTIPDNYIYNNKYIVSSFLKGLFSANGCVREYDIVLSATSKVLIEQVQLMLSSIGIASFSSTRKERIETIKGKETICKQSYQLRITLDRYKFYESIGFIQKYKMDKLKDYLSKHKIVPNKEKTNYEIIFTEYLGEEETFDITVDNCLHTYWSGGLNVSNCGEQILESDSEGLGGECCTLADTLPTKCENNEAWLKACEYAAFYAHTVTLLPTHQSKTNRIMFKNRRIGIGIIDFIGWKYNYKVHEITRLMRKGYKLIRKVVKNLSEEAGIPEPIRITTIKPNGTTAKVAGCRSGSGYSNFRYMIRRIRVQQYSKFYNILCKANIPHESDLYSANTEVFEYPLSYDDGTKTAEEVTLWEQIMNIILLQREWSDNSVSCTLMFKPKWILQRHIFGIEECTNYEENITWALTNYSINKNYYEDRHIKIIVTRNNNNQPIEIKEYIFNPKHEENDIEPALSAAIPLVKTLTMMPHTPKGVYPQTPEEGITKAEYERRIAQISPIDWSEFINEHDIETDKYCSGDKCII